MSERPLSGESAECGVVFASLLAFGRRSLRGRQGVESDSHFAARGSAAGPATLCFELALLCFQLTARLGDHRWITEEMKDLQIGTPFKTLIPSANHVATPIAGSEFAATPEPAGTAPTSTMQHARRVGGHATRTVHNTVQVVSLSAL